MPDTATSDTVPAAKSEGSQDELSEQIKLATDSVAVARNHQLIDSFIREKWRQTALSS